MEPKRACAGAVDTGIRLVGLVMRIPARWYQLSEADDDFLENAPFRYVTTVEVSALPDSTWTALTAEDTLVSWSRVVTRVRWTSPQPFGVGTTRSVTILGVLTARERYYRWESGRRKTFAAVQVSIPGLRRLAEDYVVEPTHEGSRLVWTMALEPQPALVPLLRIANPCTAWLLRRIARGIHTQVS